VGQIKYSYRSTPLYDGNECFVYGECFLHIDDNLQQHFMNNMIVSDGSFGSSYKARDTCSPKDIFEFLMNTENISENFHESHHCKNIKFEKFGET